MVRFEDLRKSYEDAAGNRPVLAGASGEIARGEFVALLGRSGSGKSTLLNLIAGIDRPDSGAVWIDSTRIDELSERDRTLFRRRHVGFVFQFFNLVPTLTVDENVQLPLELVGRRDDAARARAAELLEAVGIADRGRSYPDRLSGGEQQRVAIARALAHEPSLIIADEPTGNLDHEIGTEVMTLLRHLADADNATLLVATHSREVASQASIRWSLRAGRVEVER